MALIQKTVYIREEDLVAWNNIPNKAKWIHEGITERILEPESPESLTVVSSSVTMTKENPSQFMQIDRKKALAGEFAPVKSCKHGYDPRFCKHAKPGKPCKA